MSKSITSQHDGVCIESSKTGVHFLSGSCGSGGLEHYGKAFNQSSANMYNTILKKKLKANLLKYTLALQVSSQFPKVLALNLQQVSMHGPSVLLGVDA